MKQPAHKKILQILERFHLAVIATANLESADPEAALVAFVYNDKRNRGL
jgi:hypothetical protein